MGAPWPSPRRTVVEVARFLTIPILWDAGLRTGIAHEILALDVSASSCFRSRGSRVALLTLGTVLAVEGTARAAASARLFYGRAPDLEGCADEAQLRRAIAERVGYDPIFLAAPNSVTVSITRSRDRLVADVKLANREGLLVGSRTLQAPAGQCGELTSTIALTVAIALDTIDMLTPSESPDAAPSPAAVVSQNSMSVPEAAPPTGRPPDAAPPTSSSGRFLRRVRSRATPGRGAPGSPRA